MQSHVEQFGTAVNDRFFELSKEDSRDAHERLNALVAFYHGMAAIEEHAHVVGNQEGFKRATLDLLTIATRIKKPLLKQVEEAQIRVYQIDHAQSVFPF